MCLTFQVGRYLSDIESTFYRIGIAKLSPTDMHLLLPQKPFELYTVLNMLPYVILSAAILFSLFVVIPIGIWGSDCVLQTMGNILIIMLLSFAVVSFIPPLVYHCIGRNYGEVLTVNNKNKKNIGDGSKPLK